MHLEENVEVKTHVGATVIQFKVLCAMVLNHFLSVQLSGIKYIHIVV